MSGQMHIATEQLPEGGEGESKVEDMQGTEADQEAHASTDPLPELETSTIDTPISCVVTTASPTSSTSSSLNHQRVPSLQK